MRFFISCIIIVFLFSLGACKRQPTKQEQAADIFNLGVAINLESIEAQNAGNSEKAAELNKESLAKFREAFHLDSTHSLIRSALGHCLYIDGQFDKAILMFESDIKTNGETAMSYREMGLCKINSGKLDGKSDIEKGFSIDTSHIMREMTIQDLEDISDLAYSYGEAYNDEGRVQQGKDYKYFSIVVLTIAFEYDKLNERIGKKILALAKKSGNEDALQYYKDVIHMKK